MNHGIKRETAQPYQDAVVTYLFQEEPRIWFERYNQDTWTWPWDAKKQGYVSAYSLKQVELKVRILGPLVGMFGRDLEWEFATRRRTIDVILMLVIVITIQNRSGTLREEHFDSVPTNIGGWENQPRRYHWMCNLGYNLAFNSGAQSRASSSSRRSG